MDDKTRTNLKTAARWIANSKWNICLTGAGISVDSGIPDFRSPGGLWTRFDPYEYAHIDSFKSKPEKVWEMILEMNKVIGEAAPNPGHKGLAELEAMGKIKSVITQNVDNLHQMAGSKDVIEYHGNHTKLVCLKCGRKTSADVLKDRVKNEDQWPPKCDQCGAILKPDVTLFGEQPPLDAMEKAQWHAANSDLVLVVGTSATVVPAAYLPYLAKKTDSRIVEINLTQTQLTEMADLTLIGGASEVIPALVEEVKSILK